MADEEEPWAKNDEKEELRKSTQMTEVFTWKYLHD